MKVGISEPPAGIVPKGKPMAVPRSHAGQERLQSARDMRIDPVIFCTLPEVRS